MCVCSGKHAYPWETHIPQITKLHGFINFRESAQYRIAIVSRSQTAVFSFILGREKIGSGTPPIEKAVLASTAIGVGDYWQWLLCNR